MKNEKLNTLKSNGTWQLTTLLKKKKPNKSKWVYRVKFNVDGSLNIFKFIVVAKGYNQVPRLNFTISF